jgi:predicted phosphodiesterase
LGVSAAPAPRLTAKRVAVVSDVHGNAPALRAVLEEINTAGVDRVVSLGDATWGIQPEETRILLQSIQQPTTFVAGNGERALQELRAGREGEPHELWLRDRHSPATYSFLDASVAVAVIDIVGLGAARFCHGSPRSDIELVTPGTSIERVRAMMKGIPESVIVTGHTHLQFDRNIDGIRSVNPGSVGMPYHERRGACWAMLGPDVEFRLTSYDLGETLRAYEASDYPRAQGEIDILTSPPSPAEVIEYAESIEFRE